MDMHSDLVRQYELFMRLDGLAQNTITSRLGTYRRAQAIIPVPLHEATRDHLIEWRVTLLGCSDAYQLREVSNIRCLLKWLHEEGHITENPARRIPVPHKPFYLPHPISEADLMAAVAAARGRIRIWLVLAAWCGLRAIEIALLRRSCIRERDPEPYLLVMADSTKGHRPRRIPLCDFAVTEIRAAIAAGALAGSGPAFPRLDRQPGHLTPHRVDSLCNEFLHDECGLADTLHSLRHYFASKLHEEGVDLRDIQELMGHARADTTTVYTLVTNRQAAAAVAKLPAPRRLRAASLRSAA